MTDSAYMASNVKFEVCGGPVGCAALKRIRSSLKKVWNKICFHAYTRQVQ